MTNLFREGITVGIRRNEFHLHLTKDPFYYRCLWKWRLDLIPNLTVNSASVIGFRMKDDTRNNRCNKGLKSHFKFCIVPLWVFFDF